MVENENEISTLFVGIDGACASIIDPLAEKGTLPNLTDLLDRGVSAPLESQVPPTSVSCWTSLYTGVNPGSHGVFGGSVDRRDREPDDGISELTLWEILSLNHKRSVVVNVPVSRCNREFDGALVPGRRSTGSLEWTPPALRRRYEREFGTYLTRPNPEAQPYREYPRFVRARGDVFCYLADEYSPTFGFVVFDAPEAVLYQHPEENDLLETVYAAVDEQIGRLIDRYDPSTVIVASEHGMAPCDFEFRVNEFLRQEGFIEPTAIRRPKRCNRSERQFSPTVGGSSLASGVKRLVQRSQVGERVIDAIPRRPPNQLTVDYDASTAYMCSWDEPGIRVNRGDRGGGDVRVDGYEIVREELIDALSSLRTPTDEAMFEDVARIEKYFWGPNIPESADIVVVPRDLNWTLSTELGGDVFAEPDRTWCPTFQGFLAIRGETVDTDADVTDAHLFDIAPTVLASLEVPVSDRMDGDVLPGVPATRRFAYPHPK